MRILLFYDVSPFQKIKKEVRLRTQVLDPLSNFQDEDDGGGGVGLPPSGPGVGVESLESDERLVFLPRRSGSGNERSSRLQARLMVTWILSVLKEPIK